MTVSPAVLAIITLIIVTALHFTYVSPGSPSHFWNRTDSKARWSKVMALLSVLSCAFYFVWIPPGVVLPLAFFVAHGILAMDELR